MLQNEGTNDKRRRSPRLKALEEKREKEAREKIIGKVEGEKEEQDQVNNQQQQQAASNEDEEKDKEERIEKVEEEAGQVNQQQQQGGKRKTSNADYEKKKIQFIAGRRKKKAQKTRSIMEIMNSTSPVRSPEVVQETQHTDHSTTSSKKDTDVAPEISRRDTYFFSNDHNPPLFSTALLLDEEKQEQVNNQQQQQAASNEDEEKDKEERIEQVKEEAEAEQVNQQQQRAGKLKTYVDCEKEKIQFFAGSRKKAKRTRRIVDILNDPTSPRPPEETQHTDHSTTSSKKDKDMAPEISRRDTYFFSNDYKPPLFSTALLLDDAQKDLQYNEEAGSGSYEESLLRFTRGLGPVAQRVAAQKLEALKRFQLLKIGDDELIDHELPAAPTPEQEEDDAFINKEAEAKAKADAVSSPEEP
ncbi:hypothetical protein RIF29_06434 [Crotalaria pallida]|uniref:Uncharacterized protein n=1 Tax=Crotalaria pallida TaxID=3830 RepID=A0AAN9J369_CROPI